MLLSYACLKAGRQGRQAGQAGSSKEMKFEYVRKFKKKQVDVVLLLKTRRHAAS